MEILTLILSGTGKIYLYNKDAVVSDYLNNILFSVNLMNKGFLPFRYWGKDHIDMYTRFLINDKYEIEKINDYLCKNILVFAVGIVVD